MWMRILVRSDGTRAQLREAVAFGCDDQLLNRFEIRGREYAVYHDGGCPLQLFDATGVK